ncbi:MAG: DUF4136 domain-containing protein [Thermoanaerobaculia bacterium]
MKLPRTGLALAAAAGLACSTTPPPQAAWDHSSDFSNLKTYDWHEDPAEEKSRGGAIVDARFVFEHIHKEVNGNLEKKGYLPAGSGQPDFYVEYHTRSAGILERDKYGAYSWWSAYNYLGSSYYKENVLVIDVRDREKKLIWRGWVTRITGSNPEAIAKDIRKAVSQILASFPPGAAGKA